MTELIAACVTILAAGILALAAPGERLIEFDKMSRVEQNCVKKAYPVRYAVKPGFSKEQEAAIHRAARAINKKFHSWIHEGYDLIYDFDRFDEVYYIDWAYSAQPATSVKKWYDIFLNPSFYLNIEMPDEQPLQLVGSLPKKGFGGQKIEVIFSYPDDRAANGLYEGGLYSLQKAKIILFNTRSHRGLLNKAVLKALQDNQSWGLNEIKFFEATAAHEFGHALIPGEPHLGEHVDGVSFMGLGINNVVRDYFSGMILPDSEKIKLARCFRDGLHKKYWYIREWHRRKKG